MLEKMSEFFDTRLDIYDTHQLNEIAGAREFFAETAKNLPKEAGARILDLGAGTGLELEDYFELNPTAAVTAVDLAPGMLSELERKFAGRNVKTVLGSYFDLPFGEECYDCALSVESLHHFVEAQKIRLYRRLRAALVPGGYFILTDYFAPDEFFEKTRRADLETLLFFENKQRDGQFYHFDTPLTVEHETKCLLAAGFSAVKELYSVGDTHILRADK